MNRTIYLRISAMVAPGACAPGSRGTGEPRGSARPRAGGHLTSTRYTRALLIRRLRQVPISYSGLLGGKVSLARDWGKYFQLIGSVDYYKMGTGHAESAESRATHRCTPPLAGAGNPRQPLRKPQRCGIRGTGHGAYRRRDKCRPDISFAGGFGGGLTYNLYSKIGGAAYR